MDSQRLVTLLQESQIREYCPRVEVASSRALFSSADANALHDHHCHHAQTHAFADVLVS